MDLLEVDNNQVPVQLHPVEYKRGKSKIQDWDRFQLCAQAICLEEMRGVCVEDGAIWYWETRHRESVVFTPVLREKTEEVISEARKLLQEGKTPPPTNDRKRCKACSLVDICQPEIFRLDHSGHYIQELFTE